MTNPNPSPIGKVQRSTLKDPGVKGPVWAARTEVPKPPSDQTITEVVFEAIGQMGDGKEEYTRPDVASLPAEWVGFRAGAGAEEKAPQVTEQEKFEKLMGEETRKSRTTVLYLHGGAYYMCGFGTHRLNASKVAKACGGRALLIEYRLAPQAAFPAQLIDALNAYLYLLYPPEGSFHEPVPADDVVFVGDSAGGNLAAALLQLLLQLHITKTAGTKSPTVKYFGKDVEVPLPAGVATMSGWFDITRSMPSLETNATWDYLPPANHDDSVSRFPKDDVWPTSPPRGDMFCDLSLLCHPLVSPVAARDWSGAPPMWFMTGEELLTDEDKIVARRAAEQGVTVVWEQYEAMPHVFAMLLPALETSTKCFNSLGDFARKCVEGEVQSSATWIACKTGKESSVELAKVIDLTWEDALARMKDAQSRRLKGYEKEGKALPKPAL